MNSATQSLLQDEVPVGTPLAWPIVNEDGTLLLDRGFTLARADERTFLFEHFRPVRGDLDTGDADPLTCETARPSGLSAADMGLSLGTTLGLRPRLCAAQPMRSSRIIGIAPNHELFVTLPARGQQPLDLVPGEQLEMVSVSRQAVCWSICTIEAIYKEPLGHAVLSAPSHIKRLRMRRAVRVSVHIPVRYALAATAEGSYDGLALGRSISAGGMSLAVPTLLGAVGARLRIAFRLKTSDLDLRVQTSAIIRNVHAQKGASKWVTHGIEFETIEPAQQLAIKAFVLDRVYASVYENRVD